MTGNDTRLAVVLAAGRGTRMREARPGEELDPAQALAAAHGLKGMIPDGAGRPFLDHVLSSLADAGIDDICLVVGPDHGVVRQHYTRQPPRRIRLTFVVQQEARGTADAVRMVEPWANTRDFLVLNADNLYPVPAIRALGELGSPGLIAFDRDALIRDGNIDAARIAAFALLELDADDILTAIIEKPVAGVKAAQPAHPSVSISMNLWRFDSRIFPACRQVPSSPRGEFELPLAVAVAIKEGVRFRAIRMQAGVLDLSNRGDIATMAAQLAVNRVEP